MENVEQPTESTEQTATPVETEPTAQEQGESGQEGTELTAEQQAEASKKAEAEKATQRQSAFDKRIARMNWEKNEALREAQALREKYAHQEQQAKAEPQLHDFDSVEDFAKALTKFEQDKSEQDQNSRFEQQRSEQMRQAQAMKVDTAEAEFQKSHADYPQVVGSLISISGGQLPEHLGAAVLELGDDAPAVLYELGKDPVDYVDLLNMSPMHQLMKLGEVRASLKNNPKPPNVPNLPKPVELTQGKANTAKKNPLSMDDTNATAYIKSLQKKGSK